MILDSGEEEVGEGDGVFWDCLIGMNFINSTQTVVFLRYLYFDHTSTWFPSRRMESC